MTTLNLAVTAALIGRRGDADEVASLAQSFSIAERLGFKTGAGAGQADRVFADNRTIAAGFSEDLVLTGVLTDAFGATISAGDVAAILVFADKGNVNDVEVGGAAANAFLLFKAATDTAVVKPGGLLMVATPTAPGYPVTAGDVLKIANAGGGTAVTYTIVIIARSAAGLAVGDLDLTTPEGTTLGLELGVI